MAVGTSFIAFISGLGLEWKNVKAETPAADDS